MITVVSGLPRSGTSLAMQMLAAGGMPVLIDGERQADADNPRGYYEWERIKRLPYEPSCIAEAEGKAVKVISHLLLTLPDGHDYSVVFMQRPLAEVAASQAEMIRRRGTTGAAREKAALLSRPPGPPQPNQFLAGEAASHPDLPHRVPRCDRAAPAGGNDDSAIPARLAGS